MKNPSGLSNYTKGGIQKDDFQWQSAIMFIVVKFFWLKMKGLGTPNFLWHPKFEPWPKEVEFCIRI